VFQVGSRFAKRPKTWSDLQVIVWYLNLCANRTRLQQTQTHTSRRKAALIRDKQHIYDITGVTLTWSKFGPNQSGVRYATRLKAHAHLSDKLLRSEFKYSKLPPLKYWNPDVEFVLNKQLVKDVEAKIEVQFASGRKETLSGTGKTGQQLYDAFVRLSAPKPTPYLREILTPVIAASSIAASSKSPKSSAR
jgi:hypothetical protein